MRNFSRRDVLVRGAATGAVVAGALAFGSSAFDKPKVTQPVELASRTTYSFGYSGGSAIVYMNDADQNQTLDGIVVTHGTQLRFDIPWVYVQPEQNRFDWSIVDRVVDKARARNLDILGVITSSPPWAAYQGGTNPWTRPASASQYAQFAAAVAQRYMGKISAYEIWNEPNASMFFAPGPDPVFYASMVSAAYTAIKNVSSSLTVVAGALAPVDSGPGLIHSVQYLTSMYDHGVGGKFDALSYHPYENNASFAVGALYDNSPARQMISLHKIMKERGDGAKKIWLTEYGGSTADMSADFQRDLVLGSLQQWLEVSFAGPVYVYTIRDADSNDSHSESQFGVFTSTYQPKPLAYAIESFTRQNMPERMENQVFTTNADAALGPTVSPVFALSYGFGQECENGSRFLSNAGFLSSPPAVASIARYNGLLPMSPFANDMQDFDHEGGFRVFSRPATTGTHYLVGAILAAWKPEYGFPVSEQHPVEGTNKVAAECEFKRIVWSPDAPIEIQNL